MSITIWDLFKYIYKWKIVIIVVTILSFLGASWYVNSHQTYTAKVVIQYTDACISEGKTINGQAFDSNEIKAPVVILNVLKELGYENKKIDSVRANIGVVAITPTSVTNLKESKAKLGEDYEYHPNTFMVTYKGDSSYEATRDILSSVINNYFKYYSETYLYLAALNEVDYNLNQKNYDYLEQAELLQDNVKQTIASLESYATSSVNYRSPTTGLTFDDLLKEFQRIDEYSIPLIYSKIFEAQLSKDKSLLINKYTERMEESKRDAENNRYKASLAEERMKAYVAAHNEIQNYNLDEVIDKDVGGQTTTYDQLIKSYATDSIAANNNKIDAQYCQNVIERFTGEVDGSVDYAADEQFVQEKIAEVLAELQVLYAKTNINTSDYNSYIPAHHIKKLSGVGYFQNLSGTLYKLIAIVFGFGLACAFAIAYEVMRKYAKYHVSSDDDKEDGKDTKDGDDTEDTSDDKESPKEKNAVPEGV